jgi:probable phosphoglycerate mutase
VDEGKTDKEVIARVGKQALKQWDEAAIVPKGWQVTPAELVAHWVGFAQAVVNASDQTTTLVVTSNGVARFAPHIVGDFAGFKRDYRLKMATGALSSFVYDQGQWQVEFWNRRAD